MPSIDICRKRHHPQSLIAFFIATSALLWKINAQSAPWTRIAHTGAFLTGQLQWIVLDMPLSSIKELASRATQVRIQIASDPATYVESKPHTFPIEDIRNGHNIGYGRSMSSVLATQTWIGTRVHAMTSSVKRSMSLEHGVFWANGNANGLHWTQVHGAQHDKWQYDQSKFDFSSKDVYLELYVNAQATTTTTTTANTTITTTASLLASWSVSGLHRVCNDTSNIRRYHGVGKSLQWCQGKCLSEPDCTTIYGQLGYGDGSCWTYPGTCEEMPHQWTYKVYHIQRQTTTMTTTTLRTTTMTTTTLQAVLTPAPCNLIVDEASCVSSRDVRNYFQGTLSATLGSPCAWCCGLECTTNNQNKCEPTSWLMQQPNYVGLSKNGAGVNTCPRPQQANIATTTTANTTTTTTVTSTLVTTKQATTSTTPNVNSNVSSAIMASALSSSRLSSSTSTTKLTSASSSTTTTTSTRSNTVTSTRTSLSTKAASMSARSSTTTTTPPTSAKTSISSSSKTSTRGTAATATTTVTNTIVTTTVAVQRLRGNMIFTVPNAATFVNEKNVTSVFRTAIAEICNVNRSWVHNVTVKLNSSRRLWVLKPSSRRLARMLAQANRVGVSWTIEIPPDDPQSLIVTIIAKEFNSKTIRAVSKKVNQVLAQSGMASYAVNVTYKYSLATAAPSVRGATANSARNGEPSDMSSIIFLIVLTIVILFSVAVGGLLLYQRWSPSSPCNTDWKANPISRDALESLAECEYSQFLDPPLTISEKEGDRVRDLAQAMLSCAPNDCKVCLVYAAGKRPEDADGYGPGTYFALAILKYLYDNSINCFCDLMLPPMVPRDFFHSMISSTRHSACKSVIILQTKALYTVEHTLKEIYFAGKSGFRLFPFRFEEELVASGSEWPHVQRNSLEAMVMLNEVLQKFCKLNSIPSPPYTIVSQPSVLADMIVDLRPLIGTRTVAREPQMLNKNPHKGGSRRASKGLSANDKGLSSLGPVTSEETALLAPASTVGRSTTESNMQPAATIAVDAPLPASRLGDDISAGGKPPGQIQKDDSGFEQSPNRGLPTRRVKTAQRKKIFNNGNSSETTVPSGGVSNARPSARRKKPHVRVQQGKTMESSGPRDALETPEGNSAIVGDSRGPLDASKTDRDICRGAQDSTDGAGPKTKSGAAKGGARKRVVVNKFGATRTQPCASKAAKDRRKSELKKAATSQSSQSGPTPLARSNIIEGSHSQPSKPPRTTSEPTKGSSSGSSQKRRVSASPTKKLHPEGAQGEEKTDHNGQIPPKE